MGLKQMADQLRLRPRVAGELDRLTAEFVGDADELWRALDDEILPSPHDV
jgi:hypothetical protein